MDMRTKRWASGLLDQLRLPAELLGNIVQPGTTLGPLRYQIGNRSGAGTLRVVAVGAHDTASAVAGTPLNGKGNAFISSGTWSLMGVEIAQPVIESRVMENGFSNEGGVLGTIRLLKNITGLWILQECRRRWMELGETFSYSQLTEMASVAPAFSALIDPDHESFIRPGRMPEKIASFCRNTGQAEPLDHGSVVRVTLESLALKYRDVLTRLEMVTGLPIETLSIVGGGSQNNLLNQFTANATRKTVVSGPVEATCAGNLIIQLMADGEIDTLTQGRELIRESSKIQVFSPMNAAVWERGYERYMTVNDNRKSF
jgi:rhamnulokinase